MILTIFYDGQCPLCMSEMDLLKKHNHKNQLKLVDLHHDEFNEKYPYINKSRAMNMLHGELDTGEILLGLDVTCIAWKLVGKHKWLMILRWPGVRFLSDAVYLFFARYRNQISYVFSGKKPCKQCTIDKQD